MFSAILFLSLEILFEESLVKVSFSFSCSGGSAIFSVEMMF